MNNGVLYKDYLIQCESFQRENNGTWIPQYTLIRQNDTTQAKIDFPSHQYQFSYSYSTQREADEFAACNARRWIDAKELNANSSSTIGVDG